MRQTKQESGVTMVALVVTIVLMLIIAGILVATFSGNSGLVDKASDSQIYTELTQLRDKLNQYKAQGEAQRIKDGDYYGEMSNEELVKKEVLKEQTISYDDGEIKETVTARNGKNYDISSKLGIIDIMEIQMSPKSKLSNETTITNAMAIENPDSLKNFNNVFILDEETDNLYYVRDNTVWTLDEESEIKDNIQIADGTIQITGNPGNDTWTNEDVIVSIKYANNLISKNYTDENGKRKSTTENEVTVTVSESKTTISAQGQVDGKMVEESYTVRNIDKTAPTITYDKVENKMLDEEGNATLEVKNITVSDDLSGVKSKKYGWSSSATVAPTGDEWKDLTSNEVSKIENELGDWYLWVIATDKATNKSQEIIKCSITDGIAKVVETGITYSSVQEAIEACTKDGASYTIQLLKDTEETSSTYKGQNITLDLCGHTINNNEENTPTIENNAILNIINSTEDEKEIGKISSTNSVAIKNNENATLTLGENDDNDDNNNVSTTNPEIIGKVNGIVNNGTFNFYDGVIVADKAITGTINEMPDLYSAITTREDDKEVAFLGILADYSARINNIYYSTLQEAVNDAKENDEIYLLIPNVLSEPLIIDDSKNITINLDGNNITSIASNDYLIKNYGKLKIISRDDNYGEDIESVQCKANGIVETGVNLSGNYRIETNVIFDSYTNTYNNIWGTGSSKFESWSPKSGQTLCYRLNGTKMESTNKFVAGTTYNIVEEYKDGVATATVNGEEWINKSITSNTSSDTIKLFASTSNTCATYMTSYYFKIYKEDELVLDLIPVKSGDEKDGQIAEQTGFYDNVSKTFKYSNGTEYGTIYKGKLKQASIMSTIDSVIYNDITGILSINDATVKTTKTGTNSNYKSAIYNLGTLEGKENTIFETTNTCSYPIYNLGTYINNGSTISTGTYGIYNEAGTTEFTSGTISKEIYNKTGNVIISGGNVNSTIQNYGEGESVISGGEINYVNNRENANLKITGGTIKTLNNYSTNELNIKNAVINTSIVNNKDGNINIDNISGGCTVTNKDKGIVNINNSILGNINNENTGDIIISSSQVSTVKNSGTAMLIVKSGTVTGSITNSSTGVIELGENDNEESILEPEVQGGITISGGELNFYDGRIIGNPPVTSEIINIPEDTEILSSIENNKEVWTLTRDGLDIASITKDGITTNYKKIQDAIDDCKVSEDTIITILRNNVALEMLNIENGKIITINMDGYSITSNVNGFITNNGSLNLTGDGVLKNVYGDLIINNQEGTLQIVNGTFIQKKSGYSVIKNSGNTTIKSGTFTSIDNGLKNIDNGNITIENITLTSNTYAINNESNGKIEIQNGNIQGTTSKTSIAIYNNNENGTIEMQNGKVWADYIGIQNEQGTVKVIGGEIYHTRSDGNYGEAIRNKGSLEVEDGKVYVGGYAGYGITNYAGGTATIKGGEISGKGNGSSALLNSGEVEISGGTITGNNYSITNSNSLKMTDGTVNIGKIRCTGGVTAIEGGTVNSNTYGIEITSNASVLTIGKQGGEVSTTNPQIIGETYGINNSANGTFNFYDGIIKGETAINGNVTAQEEGYEVIVTEENEIETAILGNLPVAEVNGEQYYSINEAFEICSTDGTETIVKLLRNYNTDTTNTIGANKNVILDIQGYKITSSVENLFINNGQFRVIDSIGEGNVQGLEGTIITNEENSNFVLEDGIQIVMSKSGTSATYKAVIENKGNVEIRGGSIEGTGSYNIGINNTGNGYIKITGGTILALKGINNTSSNSIEIQGGNVRGSTETSGIGIYNNNANSIVNVTGGSIYSGNIGIQNEQGTVKVTGGEIYHTRSDGNYGEAIRNKGSLEVEDGKVYVGGYAGYGITNYEGGTAIIKGGEITGKGWNAYTLKNAGTMTIEGGTIIGAQNAISNNAILTIAGGLIQAGNPSSGTGSIVECKGGTTTIEGGTIQSTSTSTKESYGIKISSSEAVLTIGKHGGGISTTNPQIIGKTYGINNSANGTFNFYDGIIKGETSPLFGILTRVEDKYTVVGGSEDNYQTYKLGLLATDTMVAFVNGSYYSTLQGAIDACIDNQEMYIILNNGIEMTEDITIDSNKIIVIDLNGYKISGNSGISIVNEGELTIIDSNKSGEFNIEVTGNGTFVNNNY